jgi:hypothetical protein
MEAESEKVASDWITYARYEPNEAPEAIFVNAWRLYDLIEDSPSIAWDVIKKVISHYPEDELYANDKTEAQSVVGFLAAGPLEDFLSAHGPSYIEAAETEARRDRRMAWALGGMYRFTMSDDVWARVVRIADKTFWMRPSTE